MTSLDDPITYAEELTLTREDPILEDESESSSSESEEEPETSSSEEEEPRRRRPVATPDRRNRTITPGRRVEPRERRGRVEPRGRRNEGELVRHGRRGLGTLQGGNRDGDRPVLQRREGCDDSSYRDVFARLYEKIQGDSNSVNGDEEPQNPNRVFCTSEGGDVLECQMIINDTIVEPSVDASETKGQTIYHMFQFDKDNGYVIHFDSTKDSHWRGYKGSSVIKDEIGMITMPTYGSEIAKFIDIKFTHLEKLKVVNYFPLYRNNGILSKINSRSITTLCTNVVDKQSLRFMRRNRVEVLRVRPLNFTLTDPGIGPGIPFTDSYYISNKVELRKAKLKLKELHAPLELVDKLMLNLDESSISLLHVSPKNGDGTISTRFPNLKALMVHSSTTAVSLFEKSRHLFENLEHISIMSVDSSVPQLAGLIKATGIKSLELSNFHYVMRRSNPTEVGQLLRGIKEFRISGNIYGKERLCEYYYDAFEGLETLILGGTKFYPTVEDQPDYRSDPHEEVAIVPIFPVKNIVLDSFVPPWHSFKSNRVCIYDKDTPRIVYSTRQRMRHKSAKF